MIDTHQHFWQYDAHRYPWIRDGIDVLRRDYLVEDLRPLMRDNGIEAAVSVQACQDDAETDWLLDLAESHADLAGVVGWAPLVEDRVEECLERLAARSALKGIRHILHDEPDDDYMLREDFNRGVGLLRRFGLVYEILIFERHLPQTLVFVDRHPGQVFVLDHIGKPRIRDKEVSPWRERIRELARRDHVYCKLSGMVTEADWSRWSEADLQPYFDVVLEAFGPKRLMFGSDWPVLNLAGDYRRWVETVRRAIADLSADERRWIERETAKKVYRLEA